MVQAAVIEAVIAGRSRRTWTPAPRSAARRNASASTVGRSSGPNVPSGSCSRSPSWSCLAMSTSHRLMAAPPYWRAGRQQKRVPLTPRELLQVLETAFPLTTVDGEPLAFPGRKGDSDVDDRHQHLHRAQRPDGPGVHQGPQGL